MDVIRSLGDISQLRGATMVVIRLAPSGLAYSKPCRQCQCLLDKCKRKYGLRRVIHS